MHNHVGPTHESSGRGSAIRDAPLILQVQPEMSISESELTQLFGNKVRVAPAAGGGQTTAEKLSAAWERLSPSARAEIARILSQQDQTEKAPSYLGDVVVEAVPRAAENVLAFKASDGEVKGWRNVFNHEIRYDVLQVPDMLDPRNDMLATMMMPHGVEPRRFLVIDAQVQELHGAQISSYFEAHGVKTHVVVLPGEEYNKRPEAVDTILEQCCIFGLHRREPIIGIGGGVILDIVGLAANLYRRGVPYVRVPTTLLAIVDASVGVKNGVDYPSEAKGPQKNRMGSFFAPCAALLDKSFIATQDERNIINGMGEIMKLALVRDAELFDLLEEHGARLVREQFQGSDGVAADVIERSIQVMLEELGPNLWEKKLERCVDYGHSFSKILEMFDEPYIMHGEAVNVDGWFCVLLSLGRDYLTEDQAWRIFRAMKAIGMPTTWEHCEPDVLWRGLEDAVEHRHGAQRLPLCTSIGSSVCVNDVTREEVAKAVDAMHRFEKEWSTSA